VTRTIVQAQATSAAPAAAVYAHLAAMTTWPRWKADTDWVKLKGPFAEGTKGTIKPLRGAVTHFVIERIVPDRTFVNVTKLTLARLTFVYSVAERPDGGSDLGITVNITGLLSGLWTSVLAKGLNAGTQRDLDALAELAEEED
jgi:hypothetical protein